MKPIVDGSFLIKKKPDKGGWHYVVVNDIPDHFKSGGGMVRIRGTVDNYAVKQFKLLPMKEGGMVFPLNQVLRKAIGKKEGDQVRVRLFPDSSDIEVPEEIWDSLRLSPRAHAFFVGLSDSNKKYYIDWVYASKKIETRAGRIVKMLAQLERRQKFWDWPDSQR